MARLLSEQEQLRRAALAKLRGLGIDPYPAAEYTVTHHAKELASSYKEGAEGFEHVRIAGRLMTKRIMGKASFAVLSDATGEMQIYVNRDEICPEEDKTMYNDVFKKLLDIGDFIGAEGHMFTTQTGEMSLHVKELVVLSKSLRPLPVVKKDADGNVYDQLTDPEIRYRQRYVDLVVNPGVKEIFRKRNRVMSTMRRIFDDAGYMEVETPILQPIPGGAAARPFITHHNALDTPLYLRIANELYLKRLIVGGFEGVYEFAKDFRGCEQRKEERVKSAKSHTAKLQKAIIFVALIYALHHGKTIIRTGTATTCRFGKIKRSRYRPLSRRGIHRYAPR